MLHLYLRAIEWLREGHENGQALLEYALIVGLVSVVLIIALFLLAGTLTTTYSNIRQALTAL